MSESPLVGTTTILESKRRRSRYSIMHRHEIRRVRHRETIPSDSSDCVRGPTCVVFTGSPPRVHSFTAT